MFYLIRKHFVSEKQDFHLNVFLVWLKGETFASRKSGGGGEGGVLGSAFTWSVVRPIIVIPGRAGKDVAHPLEVHLRAHVSSSGKSLLSNGDRKSS